MEREKCDGVYSDLEFRDYETMTKTKRYWKSKRGSFEKGWMPPHPTLYLKKKVFDRVGLFNLKYKICADYDFMIRILKCNTKLYYIEKVLVYMRSGGISTDGFKGYYKNFKESYRMLKDNKIPFALFVNVKRTIKTLTEMLFS